MKRLIVIIAAKSPDCSTLDELHRMIEDKKTWPTARGLHERIRHKYVKAERSGDDRLMAQYDFEEVCAKSLCNFAVYVEQWRPGMGFDPDAQFWILPNALVTARQFGIDEKEIITAVLPD